MNIQMDWKGGFKFSGTSLYGHEISTDASKKIGGAEDGYQPLELLMFSLAGCTGVDVIDISRKMRLDIADVRISIEANQREEVPRFFTDAHVTYHVTGKNIDRKKMERVIELSQEKYCSAAATIAGVCKLSHSLEITEV